MVKAIRILLLLAFCIQNCSAIANQWERKEIERIYNAHVVHPSDINEHLPHLRQLASECSTAVEIGIRSMVSTWAILQGLSESLSNNRAYIGIDLDLPPWGTLQMARELSEAVGVSFQFWKGNDMKIEIPAVDMLFIDSLHTYCHLTFELEKFSPKVRKYIAMHDTSAPWGTIDDVEYRGDYSEYDLSIDRKKRGLWPAVVDFLKNHPEWVLYRRQLNNHGFTVLKRIEESGKEKEPQIEAVLLSKIILCTGPSLNRKEQLKTITENDMKHIPFKKIFLSTNDLQNVDVVFNTKRPVVELIYSQGHQLDYLNCIINSIRRAVNDPDCLDDDIILFKYESVFINDMHLVRKAVGKILLGYDAVTRFSDLDMTDVFFIKVSSARELFRGRQTLNNLTGYSNCEDYFTKTVFNILPNVYRVRLNRINRHWEDNELGFFHIFPSSVRDRTFWDKKNYDEL